MYILFIHFYSDKIALIFANKNGARNDFAMEKKCISDVNVMKYLWKELHLKITGNNISNYGANSGRKTELLEAPLPHDQPRGS